MKSISRRKVWQSLSLFVLIFMISYSCVTIFHTSSISNSTSNSNQDCLSFSLKLGFSYGTQPLVNIGFLFQSGSSNQETITSISSLDQSTLIFDFILNSFDIFEELNCLFVGILTSQIKKLDHFSKDKKDWGNNRSLVKFTITQNPGISLRGISRASGLAMGSTQYWLRILLQENEIEVFSYGKSNHYFERDQEYSTNERILYALLQNKRIYAILDVLNSSPSVKTQKDLCIELGYNKSLLSYYMKILKNHQIVESGIQDLEINEEFKIYLEN